MCVANFSDVFPGIMKKGIYILEECPYCSGKYTSMFSGRFSVFNCNDCNTVRTYEQFVNDMAHDIMHESKVSALQAPKSPDGLVDIADVYDETNKLIVPSGFNSLDRMTGGFKGGEITIISGKRSDGKSTFTGQMSLNMIEKGNKVFFYSGELSAPSFRNWIFLQSAGENYLESYYDDFGALRYRIDKEYAEPKIRAWLRGKLILYDNKVIKTSEVNTIIERANIALEYHGCNVFFVDNLKTARFKKDNERDYYRKQANFVADMLAFAQQNNVHVVMVAHPKKEDTGDQNDNVAGLSDITDIAHYVLTVERLRDEKIIEHGCDAILHLSKNRGHGEEGSIKMNFHIPSKRFHMQNSDNIEHYDWEDQY
jgi:twinkle protein